MKRALRGLKNAATSTIARITGSQGTINTTDQSSDTTTAGPHTAHSHAGPHAPHSRTGPQTPATDHTAPNPGRYAIDPRGTIAAVIVTHNRVDLLERSLDMVAKQTRRPDWVIVVDNGADPAVETLVHATLGGEPQSRRASAEIAARRFAEIQTVGAAITKASEEVPDGAAANDNDDATTSTSASSSPSAASGDVPQRRPRPMYLPSRTNLGGGGGFALGFLAALALGADAIWCADDDGRPADENVLATLLDVAEREQLAQVSPLVTNINNPDRLAFPLRQGLTWRRRVSELEGDFLPGIASLFNGALISARAMEIIGVPDYRLFIRGDEVEYHRRIVRSGLRFGTSLTCAYAHPDGSEEFKPILGGRMHTQYPDGEFKRYFTYRNRGYLMSQPGMRRLLPQEYARFAWFFLVQRKDVAGFREWLQLHTLGRQERFERPE
ncbi:glycosyltransferase family 2 protein [Corynebacterium sp. UMB4614]|uniref:galactofuranosyltransferase GlfT1 n=1 Tax=Corynebacterium sp. UMB4614 TaxID=3046334 RepID=UPI00254B727E|nr:glycosyltransferase family 2 protein [Corynebacterium sp. UMB4614]MDK7135633.1 glycosyltransferase family 2 protein [Corynebacterium sp. UMB4614]